ncbi:Aldehyde reductase protein [Halorhabdus tiamatea SARL4B]|uniref:Aldehyde reductase protein n=1 Tax=Halorhabdus tiamatea SARL4B TaxID=1033806 RepID=F7PN82_9EURY|nr:aldo/keto reductase [Halorhabdus tiamatea]ERJ07787.1 Aldehyde reductase protein [Halorhabdus tiamatea SARL4B]CCQ32555.1 aldo/keto reductase family oxidoreductase [Halorhabdus tiamatea SARL4B]
MENLPAIGLGTPTDADACRRAVRTALDAGYRFLDTAQMYDNERAVGAGLAESDVPREDVVVATKLAPGNLTPDAVRTTTEESLDRLGLDRVDLLYVHWPRDTYDPEQTLPALETLRDDGLIDAIGVSNFSPALLDEARTILDDPIRAHQVECHPLCPQAALRADAANHDTQLVAYSPLGRGALLDHTELTAIAAEIDETVATTVLAWLHEKDIVPTPRSATPAHIESNRRALDVELPPPVVDRLDAVEDRYRTVDPDFAVWNDG